MKNVSAIPWIEHRTMPCMPIKNIHTNDRLIRKCAPFRACIKYTRVAADEDKKWE